MRPMANLMRALVLCFAIAHGKLVELVDTRIGTGGFGFGVGGDNPGPQVPFGVCRAGPDTDHSNGIYFDFNHFGGYYYGDDRIRGFSHTHLVGAGVGDWGNVGLMPVNYVPTNATVANADFHSKFSHSQETVRAGYYGVQLSDSNVKAELTAAGTHAAIHRYTFNQPSSPRVVVVDACHTVTPGNSKKGVCAAASVEVDAAAGEIRGFVVNHGSLSGRNGRGVQIWFTVRFEAAGSSPSQWKFGVWQDSALRPAGTSAGATNKGNLGAYFNFGNTVTQVVARVGISFVNASQATANLNIDAPSTISFDTILGRTTAVWERQLGLVEVVDQGSISKDRLVSFYSAVYHSFNAPSVYSEPAGGVYMGYDNQIHTWPNSSASAYYSDMSDWDVHRSQLPWLALMTPRRSRDILQTLVVAAQQGGDVPRWPLANVYTDCMSGLHTVVTMADNWLKGIRDWDLAAVYPYVKAQCTTNRPHGSRGDVENYVSKGYTCQENVRHGASETLEYAFDDWAAGTLAKALGKTDDFNMFNARAQNYRKLWSGPRALLCPKSCNGSLLCPNEIEAAIPYPFNDKGYVEGDAWQYIWFVPQDPSGLISLFPTVDAFVKKLDFFFNESMKWNTNDLPNPFYWAGNEPDILAVWLFNFAGRPDLTAKWSRYLLNKYYPNTPDGIPGNDDFGTMSAWNAFATLGLYPLAGSTTYMVGSPVFPRTVLHLEGIGDVTLIAHDASETNIYVQKMNIDGQPVTKPLVDYAQFKKNTVIEFWMGSKPSNWGALERERPHEMFPLRFE